jgi:hypothetical protein
MKYRVNFGGVYPSDFGIGMPTQRSNISLPASFGSGLISNTALQLKQTQLRSWVIIFGGRPAISIFCGKGISCVDSGSKYPWWLHNNGVSVSISPPKQLSPTVINID